MAPLFEAAAFAPARLLGGVTELRSEHDDEDEDEGDEFEARPLVEPADEDDEDDDDEDDDEAGSELGACVDVWDEGTGRPLALTTVWALLDTPDELLAALDETADEVDDVGDTLQGGWGGDERDELELELEISCPFEATTVASSPTTARWLIS